MFIARTDILCSTKYETSAGRGKDDNGNHTGKCPLLYDFAKFQLDTSGVAN